MSRKIQLRLISSPKMSDAGENDTIRFPKKARDYFGFANNVVVLGKGEYQLELRVKKAYRADVQRLTRMISQGRISDEQAMCAGFVSKSIQSRIQKKEGSTPWVSDGAGPITVGADPEFGLVDHGNILRAGHTILPHDGSFGSDGPSAEVRPPPAREHTRMINNISDILHDPPPQAADYQWIGGATYHDVNRDYWFGGHIHLGRPSQLAMQVADAVYPKIAKILDHLVALPLVLLDTPQPHLRRNGCKYGYGKAGRYGVADASASIRVAECGNRFEYRVLSGLWLTHPTLAKIIVGTTKAVAETAYGRVISSGDNGEFVEAPASRKGLLKTFKLKDTLTVETIVNGSLLERITPDHLKLWENQLRSLDCYEDYSSEIDAFIALVNNNENVKDHGGFNLDLKANWINGEPLLPNSNRKVRQALEATEEM